MRLFSECSENPQQFCFHGLLLAFFVVIGLILLFAFLLHYFKKYETRTLNIFLAMIFVFFRNNRDSTILRPNSFFRPSNPSSRALPRCTIKQPQNFKTKFFWVTVTSQMSQFAKSITSKISHFAKSFSSKMSHFAKSFSSRMSHFAKPFSPKMSHFAKSFSSKMSHFAESVA